MEYRILGKSGLRVSRICLGTMTFGGQLDESDSIAIVDAAIGNGINFFDCADVYMNGQSETILGKALRGKRDRVVLASKCAGKMSDDINDAGLSRGTIIRHVNDSLARLDTDYLDVLLLHFPDYETDLESIVYTMETLIRNGKIRHYGISNFPAWMACSCVHLAREMNAPEPIVSENVYNVVTRGLDDELLPFLARYGLGLITFNPLAGGLLTGKHRHGKLADNSRLSLDSGYARRYVTDSNIKALDDFMAIANEEKLSPVQLSYQWLLSKGFITSIICGVSKMSQLQDNLRACEESTVSDDALARCDELWQGLKGTYFNYHY